jgi:hypothetical protein
MFRWIDCLLWSVAYRVGSRGLETGDSVRNLGLDGAERRLWGYFKAIPRRLTRTKVGVGGERFFAGGYLDGYCFEEPLEMTG